MAKSLVRKISTEFSFLEYLVLSQLLEAMVSDKHIRQLSVCFLYAFIDVRIDIPDEPAATQLSSFTYSTSFSAVAAVPF